jgi:hypothetical protein
MNFKIWFEIGASFGKLKEHWDSTPLRLFIKARDKQLVDNMFCLLHLKLKNNLFDQNETGSFCRELENINQTINDIIRALQHEEFS